MKKNDRKSRTTKLRLIELAVWLIILFIIGCIISVSINYYHETYESHNLYMPDVDGLIVGSPVNMMGVSIGHITKIKIIKDDEIKVRFKVLNRKIHIPKGTIATVDFSGLGGSKSLVLYPPDSNREIPPERLTNNTDFIMVERPRRLRDSYALLFEMYNTFMNIIYTISDFSKNVRYIESPKDMSKKPDLTTFTNFYDSFLDTSTNNLRKLRTELEKKSNH